MNNKIYPCLWFDNKAQEAAEFYCQIFPNSKIISSTPQVTVYEMEGKKYMNLNGGPLYSFSEAVSLVITCENQEEIDHYWNRLSEQGEEGKCGWLKDKYGFSWQVVPSILGKLMNNSEKAPRIMKSFMQMKKIIIKDLENA